MQTLSKAKKNQGWVTLSVKLSLFLILIWILFLQIKKISWSTDLFKDFNLFSLFLVVALVPLNWFCEFKKWKISMRYISDSFKNKAIKNAFMAGIVTGMLTPNMLGNFVGRMFYFPRKYRLEIIILTTYSNLSQFIWSIIFGVISIVVISFNSSVPFFSLSILIIGFLLIFYFYIDRFLLLFPFLKKWVKRFISFNLTNQLKWQLLLWSGVRNLIFSVQFLFVLHFFNQDISLQLLLWIWQVYLFVTLSPSLFLGKIVIRESIAVWVLTAAGINPTIVVFSSLTIWLLNLFIPTITSLIFYKSPNIESE
jgi:hypothetical protein